jgi:siroheme synthase
MGGAVVVDMINRLLTNATVVVYMPGNDLALLAARLQSSGVAAETPCAIIASATQDSELVHITTVAKLASSPNLPAPRLLIVGEVVRFADASRLQQQFGESAVSAEPLREVSSSVLSASVVASTTRENAE